MIDFFHFKSFQLQLDNSKTLPTLHNFDKKVAEADAYLQLLINQVKVNTRNWYTIFKHAMGAVCLEKDHTYVFHNDKFYFIQKKITVSFY